MEMWLKTDSDSLRFPVLPSTFNIQDSAIINQSNITNLGDINLFGGKGLRSTEITAFFPNKVYSFCNYTDFPKAYECVAKIKKWQDTGTILRFIVTETNINISMVIEKFEYAEQNGTRDVYFSLSLKEYRSLILENNTVVENTSNTTRPSNTTSGTSTKTHTVVKNDTLWDLAQKYYNKGWEWKKIVDKNKSKYPSLNNSTVLQIGWVLEI